ncbi:MAG: adenylate/guanylate cyclase domain-containing protein [Elusimicrobia bacterium]|nr:adenylate/guanylate cyclase domain-containing protein [Elusimicrobiota bacterium]
MRRTLARRLDRSARWLVPLALLAALLVLRAADAGWVQALQFRAFDAFLNLRPRPYQDLPVRVIDIDEESLAKVGQWPWPRTVLARLVERLTADGASTIVFDATFPEPDRTSPARVVRSWPDSPALRALKARADRLPDHDRVFARAIAASRVVMGFAPRVEPTSRLPEPKARFAYGGDGPLASLRVYKGAADNLPVLDRAAAGLGSFGYEPEHDGVIRRAPLLWNIGGRLFPSLSLEALRVAQGATEIAVKSSGASGAQSYGAHVGIEKIKVGQFVIPTDAGGRIWVDYSPEDPRRTISAWRVLDSSAPLPSLQGAICLIGTSAAGLIDLRATPLEAAAPGVSVHANILEQVLTGSYLRRPDWADGAELTFTLALGLLLLLLLTRVGAAWSAPVGLGMAAGALWLSWHAFTVWHRLLDPVFPVATLAAVYLSFAAVGYVKSEKERRKITDTFGRYLSPKVVEGLAKNPGAVELGGETREMTFHFCDVRGFTTISEQFDPHGLTEFINRFLTPMTQIVLDHDGTIDKYMGDCIMAFWNAPVPVPDHARRACAAALAMHAKLAELNAAWQAEAAAEGRALPEIRIGTGLNTGSCVVGNMGSTLRVDYTVLGDDVNLASRLEGQSKAYGVGIVIGPRTREQAPEFAALELDLIKVKGKTRPVRIFALLGGPDEASCEPFRALASAHERMLAAYRAQDWDGTERLIKEARGLADGRGLGKLYDLYASRAAAFRAAPPPADWDGVFTATSK